MKHQPVRQGQTTTPGTTCPTLFGKCVDSLTSPATYVTLKMQETGPAVKSPYPIRLESLPICRYNYKGSTFFSGNEPSTSCTDILNARCEYFTKRLMHFISSLVQVHIRTSALPIL